MSCDLKITPIIYVCIIIIFASCLPLKLKKMTHVKMTDVESMLLKHHLAQKLRLIGSENMWKYEGHRNRAQFKEQECYMYSHQIMWCRRAESRGRSLQRMKVLSSSDQIPAVLPVS